MKILDSYLRRHLARGFLLVLFVLLSLFTLLDFIEELDDTILGNYSGLDALIFVLMTLPERAIWLVPISALIGTLVGLSLLDHGNELTVLRTSGISVRRITASILKSATVLVLIVIVFAQFIGPAMGARAWRERALAIAGDIVLRKESGTNFWFRDGRRFISVSNMVYGRIPTGIEIYEFNDAGELTVLTEAFDAERDPNGEWLLQDVFQKRTNGLKIETEHLPILHWDGFLSPQQGAVIELDAESLAPTDLYFYSKDLRARGQNATRYELTFWRKLAIPVSTIAMVLIAVPFAFGSVQRGGIGLRLLLGAGVGVVFYLLDQLVAQLGLLVELQPALAALGPSVALLIVAVIWSRRVS